VELLQIYMGILPAIVHKKRRRRGCWVAGISPPSNQNLKK
jgi:hypothetical protein